MSQKFDPDNTDFLQVAVEWHGNICAIAEYYGVSKETIYQHINRNENGKKAIEYARAISHELFLDQAEFVFRYNMNQYRENPAISQRAAEKVVDKFGHLRKGYEVETKDAQPKNDELNELKHQLMILQAENDKLRAQQNQPKAEQEFCGGDPSV